MGEHDTYCPFFQHTVELLGRRWTGTILRALITGPKRFGEVRDAIPGLSDRLLSERLHELEGESLVVHRRDMEPSVYELTEQGLALEPVFDAMVDYTQAWAAGACAPERPGRIRDAS